MWSLTQYFTNFIFKLKRNIWTFVPFSMENARKILVFQLEKVSIKQQKLENTRFPAGKSVNQTAKVRKVHSFPTRKLGQSNSKKIIFQAKYFTWKRFLFEPFSSFCVKRTLRVWLLLLAPNSNILTC